MSEKSGKGLKRDHEINQKGKKSKKKFSISAGLDKRKIIFENDAFYKFKEPDLEKAKENLEYSPVYFLRAHSKNNDSADVQTQIWQCVFEPDPKNSCAHTDIVATCGGNSVCFINVESGQVVLKYNRNSKVTATENLYALAWSTLPLDDLGIKQMNILAAAGGKSTIVLIHPEEGCCYQMFRTVPNKAASVVCSLLFHPKKSSWLFCGHEDGHIQLWDVGIPSLPNYDVVPCHLTTIAAVAGDAYNLVFSSTHDLLISGCDKGLYAWHIEMDKIENNHRLDRTLFALPESQRLGSIVDSITLIRDDILAAKCALHGCIYIFSISVCCIKKQLNADKQQYEVNFDENCIMKLEWSKSDNYYMNMGVDPKSCILVCGDDKGRLWVYDLFPYINGDIKSPLTGNSSIKSVNPSLQLEWPELEDSEVEKARKLRLDSYDIVVDKCTVSDGGQYIVAVTSNNMVCIWKRGEDPSSSITDEVEDEIKKIIKG